MDPPPVLRRQGYQDGQPKKTSPMRILVAAIVLTACVGGDSLAHDSWISRGNHRNAAGEWCCGAGDCFIVPKERVMMTGEGYVVIQGPHLPALGRNSTRRCHSAKLSRRPTASSGCRRPNGSRRCFFAPPPST
jgi:hypothetical protein